MLFRNFYHINKLHEKRIYELQKKYKQNEETNHESQSNSQSDCHC